MSEHIESEFVAHVPCPKCASSDANSIYTDGHQYCFACRTYTHPDGDAKETPHQPRMSDNLISDLSFQGLDKRKLTEETCRHWGYGIGQFKGQPVQVANYRTTDGTRVVAQKIRFANKDFLMLGEPKGAGLYGQHLWRDGGKMLVVTEGEIDALSVSQIQNLKWPVVSVPSGASGARKALSKQLEWLERFETVVLMFDMDEPGQAAASECADLLTPGKCKVARLPLKDANDMLKAGRGAEVIDAIWGAKVHRPDGVVAGTELWDAIIKPEPEGESIPFPYPNLQDMTRGMRKGELILLAAGSGIGKSEVCRQIYTHTLLTNPTEKLGLIHLEEKTTHTALGMMGYFLRKRVTLSREGVSEAELRRAFDATVGSGRVFLYDHFGSSDSENLFAKIRYFAKGCGCDTIVLDHISMVVSGIEDGDERRIIDNLMTKLAKLAQELNVRIILITHLKKPMGTPHEEGGRVSLDDFRGSGAIKQLTHTAIGLERNQQDDNLKRFTLSRVLKCRHTGITGEADWLEYDGSTGILTPCAGPAFDEPAPSGFTAHPPDNKDF